MQFRSALPLTVLILFAITNGVTSCPGYCSSTQQKCIKKKHLESGYNIKWKSEYAKAAKKRAAKKAEAGACQSGRMLLQAGVIKEVCYLISDTAMKTETCVDYWNSYKNAVEKLYQDSIAGCGVSFKNSFIAVVCLYKKNTI